MFTFHQENFTFHNFKLLISFIYVINFSPGQQLFCLTRERMCCSRPLVRSRVKKKPSCCQYLYSVSRYRYDISLQDIFMRYQYLILLPDIVTKHSKRYRCEISLRYIHTTCRYFLRYSYEILLGDIVARYRYEISASLCRLSGSATRRLQSLRLAEETELYQQNWQIPL